MREKLHAVEQEFNRLAEAMSTQEVAADPEAYRKHAKAHSDLSELGKRTDESKNGNSKPERKSSM